MTMIITKYKEKYPKFRRSTSDTVKFDGFVSQWELVSTTIITT